MMRIVGGVAAAAALVGCFCCWMVAAQPAAAAQMITEITRGFTASPTFPASSSSSVHFQSLLSDPSGTFSFGFLLMPMGQLDVAVIHVPSSLPLWTARANSKKNNNFVPPLWKPSTTLSFDGRLLLQDTTSGTLFWSTEVDTQVGSSTLVLRNTSNLQIIIGNKTNMESAAVVVLWRSFDFPSDTIVQDQNFTSAAQLWSANSRFSMRLGPNYLGLYYNYYYNNSSSNFVMYWKRTALEARAEIVQGEGPIYARINASDGFLGMYQEEGPPADVMSFDSFNRHISAALFRRLTLEPDGNLGGYYWNGSFWVPDFQAISDMCSLPTSCGAYALCHRNGSAGSCSCLDSTSAESPPPNCLPEDDGEDLCSSSSNGNKYWVVRTAGVDLPYKEFIGFTKMSSLEECEGSCERNCSCWGAIYSNSSGYCYTMDFPIETLVEVGGQGGKTGYFKVIRSKTSKNKQGKSTTALRVGVGVGAAALLVVGLIAAALILRAYNKWRTGHNRRKSMAQGSMLAEGLSPVPHRDLKDTPSFRSNIELSVSSSSSSLSKCKQQLTRCCLLLLE